MKKLLLMFAASLTMLFWGCTQFDDSRIWDAIDELEDLYDDLDERVEDLEEACEKMNTNIEALQTLVSALQNNDTITTIAPIKQGDKVVGYTISFSKSEPITIYHGNDGKDGANGADGQDGANGVDGKDGKDGYTPQIGVAKDSDNVYYWTLDGEWLLDESGNKIKAVGTDGKDGQDGSNGNDGANGTNGEDGKDGENGADGKDGITPQLEIRDGYWYISYDNGATWKELGKATGEDGKDGADGEDGKDGADGANGSDGQDGKDGADGKDGTNGKDGDSLFESVTWDDEYAYFTLADGTIIKLPMQGGSVMRTNEIWYTSTDGNIVEPYWPRDDFGNSIFGANIVSNTYENGRGVIKFDGDVTKIGGGTFDSCSTLESITIPNSVEEFGVNPFLVCSSLAKFEGKFASADGRCLIDEGKLISFAPSGLSEYAIPEGISEIGDCAFFNCSSVILSAIPEGVTTIGESAFFRCTFDTLLLPSSLTFIGNMAFAWSLYGNNIGMYQLYCLATTPPTLGGDDIGLGGCFIVVPAASVEAYKQSDWNNLWNVTIIGDDEVCANMYGEGTLAFLQAIVDGNMLGDQTPTITDWTDLSQVYFPAISMEIINNKLEICRIGDGESNFTDLPDVINLPELTVISIANNTKLAGKELPKEWNTPKLEYCQLALCNLTGTIPDGLASTTPNMHTLFLNGNKFYGALPHYWASGVNGGSGKLECVILANVNNKNLSAELPIVATNESPGLGYMVPAMLDVKLNKWINDDPSQGHENPSRDKTQIKLGGVFEQNYIGFEKGWGQERYVKYGGGMPSDTATWNDHRLLIDEWAWYFSNMGYTDRCMPIPHVMLDWDQAAAEAYTAEAKLVWGGM